MIHIYIHVFMSLSPQFMEGKRRLVVCSRQEIYLSIYLLTYLYVRTSTHPSRIYIKNVPIYIWQSITPQDEQTYERDREFLASSRAVVPSLVPQPT
jgi:hypothetical protein